MRNPVFPLMLVLVALTVSAGCAPPAKSDPASPQSTKTPASPPPSPTSARDNSEKKKGTAPTAQPKPSKGPSLDEMLLFFPTKYPDGDWEPKGLDFEDVWFNAEDGTRLHGWYCPCKNPRAVLLYAHGNAGNLSYGGSLVQYFQKQLRVTALIFDYRGYGRSKGVPTVEGILQDARAARTWLARRAKVEEAHIVLMGRSLGGAVVVQLAAEKRPRGLILESTFSSLKDVATRHYPRLAWLVPADKLNSVAKISGYRGPLLQSHGDADRTVPYTLGRKLFAAANEPKSFVTIAGGDHNDPQSTEYFDRLHQFIGALPDGKR